MTRPSRFFRQVARHMRKESRLSVGSFLVLTIVLILIDLFWIASLTINNQYRQILQGVRMELFLAETLSDSALGGMERSLLSLEGVDSVGFVSKSDAAEILSRELGPGILEGLEENPLPRSFILSFRDIKGLRELDNMKGHLSRLQGVDEIEFGRNWIEKVENGGATLRRVGYGVGGMILLVVLLTMANTNRLTARSKSQEIAQLKLLGAGPSFLLYPFLFEGFMSAVLAALIGWGIMQIVSAQLTPFAISVILPQTGQMLIYSLLSGFTGMVGAYLGIRRSLVQ